jgi:hypothetical protein
MMPMVMNIKTKLIMNSGKEYILNKHPEDVLSLLIDEKGAPRNGFINCLGFSFNPRHVSSIECIEERE